MRALIVNDAGISGGGAETRIRLLAEEFLRRRVFEEIHILGAADSMPDTPKGLIRHSLSASYALDWFKIYKVTRQIIKRHGINIVQVHNMQRLSPSPLLAASHMQVPVVWIAHDYWPLCAYRSFINPYKAQSMALCEEAKFKKCIRCVGIKAALRLKLFQWVISKADVAISPGNFVKDLYESHNILKGKWKIVRPWVALDIFEDVRQNEIPNQIIFVGSLADYKGGWVAAESLKYILEVFPDTILKFIGPNQEKDGIFRKRIEEIGIRDSTLKNMVFLGYKDHDGLRDEYSKGGISLCPPVWFELFGLTWAEAMAAGCPVVASSIGSLPEFLKGKGILVPARDAQRLAGAVIDLLKNKDYAKNLAEEGKRYAIESFKVNRAADEIIDIYKQLIRG